MTIVLSIRLIRCISNVVIERILLLVLLVLLLMLLLLNVYGFGLMIAQFAALE